MAQNTGGYLMEIKPVRHYATPDLPTREITDENPELLRLLPKRWQGNAAVVAALTACLAMSSCAASASAAKSTPKHTAPKAKAKPAPVAASRIAPVFVHGSGIGSFGCEVVNPPTFLSEDEARQVIVEEAKRSGIKFEQTTKTLPGVPMPTTGRVFAEKQPARQMKRQAIVLDGFDKKHNIAFEYVSHEDLVNWEGDPDKQTSSTVSTHMVIGAAKDLQVALSKAKPAGTYAVFYDPVALEKFQYAPGGDLDALEARATAAAYDEARNELRAQVKDFIKWLKAQGVI